MKKRDWALVVIPLLLTWIIDRFTKHWATGLTGIDSHGVISFVLHQNQGAMLGLFTELPKILRVVSLSTGGAFLLCFYAIIQYLLPIRSMVLRMGLSVLIGGIIGNVTDRIIWGYVVDFIVIGSPTLSSPAFNLADALQWLGYGMIIYAILREGELLWPEHNTRRQYWVNVRFQLRYCFFLMGVGLSLTLIGLVFSYTYLRVTISELVGNNTYLINKFLGPFVITYIIIFIAFSAILFAIGKYISHRIAGPIYAFEKFLTDLLDGHSRPLKLRAGDEFQELSALSEQLRDHYKHVKNDLPSKEQQDP